MPLIILLFLVAINLASASTFIISRKERLERMSTSKVQKITSFSAAPVRENRELIMDTDSANDVADFIERAGKLPGVWDFTNQYDLKTGTTLKGRLLNSVVSTNLDSPLLIEVLPGQVLPDGTKLTCVGTTKHKRVVAACNLLITPTDAGEEYPVKISLLNIDGSSGLKADYFYSGKEEYVAGAVAMAFSRGVVESSQDRVATPVGQITPSTVKNNYLNGVMGSMDELTSMMRQEMQTREPKVFIKAGKEVLIYFNERFKI